MHVAPGPQHQPDLESRTPCKQLGIPAKVLVPTQLEDVKGA